MFLAKVVWLILGVALISGCAISGCAPQKTANSDATKKVVGTAITSKVAPNFTSEDAKFSIYFPAKPTEKRTPTKDREKDSETFQFLSETAAVSYIVIAITIPPNVDSSDAADFINGMQQGFLEAGATLEKSRDINLDGVPGRELRTNMLNGTASSRIYMYLTPRISYQIVAVGLKKDMQSQQAQIEKVLNSFRLKK